MFHITKRLAALSTTRKQIEVHSWLIKRVARRAQAASENRDAKPSHTAISNLNPVEESISRYATPATPTESKRLKATPWRIDARFPSPIARA